MMTDQLEHNARWAIVETDDRPKPGSRSSMIIQPHMASCPCDGEQEQTGLLDVDDMVDRVVGLVRPSADIQTLDLSQARGRVLATQIRSPQPMPFFDNSAMDGFAVFSGDLAEGAETLLPVLGESAAGGECDAPLAARTCMSIYTGARIPQGCDAVVPVEAVEELGDRVRFSYRPEPGAHIRPAGSDIAGNAILVEAGTRIEARHASLLAANGYSRIDVCRQPRVALISTGDELCEAGDARGSGQLFDCNRPMLKMALEAAGCKVTDIGILPDDLDKTVARLAKLGDRHDLIVASGSVSVGNRDFLKRAIVEAGGTIKAWKAAVKPGKPVAIGRLQNAAFIGLAGNPYAAWIGFHLFVRPVVDVLQGAEPSGPAGLPAIAGEDFPHKPGRREYAPVRVMPGNSQSGVPVLTRIGNGGSASLNPVCLADGLAVIPASVGTVEAGRSMTFLPFNQGLE